MNKTYALKDVPAIAADIISTAPHKKLLFYGEMGVGKTTLIKEICKQLKVTDVISSPTFSLVNEYQTAKNETIYHFDFYRIEDEVEALDMGIEDYFYTNNWCFIEWPEHIKNLLPLDAVAIQLTATNNNLRTITLTQP